MKRFLDKTPRVVVAVESAEKSGRDKLHGILRYVRLHGPWNIHISENRYGEQGLGRFEFWKADGLILSGYTYSQYSLAFTRRIPIVFVDFKPALMPRTRLHRHLSVNSDARQIGVLGAEHYLAQGVIHFAYVGAANDFEWSRHRGDAFNERVKADGFDCHQYATASKRERMDWGLEQVRMRKWLLNLPKPVGLFAATDGRARQVIDNDEMLCEHTLPTLSSILPDFEGSGYLSAEMLDRMMRGEICRERSLPYGVTQLVQRESSLCKHPANHYVMAALEYIRANACAGITVMDVVRHLKVSRRLIELRFRETYGRSILGEIQQTRLNRVECLLKETHLPIGEIGPRCGYPTETYLKKVFKAQFGMTMRTYRNAGHFSS